MIKKYNEYQETFNMLIIINKNYKWRERKPSQCNFFIGQ